MAHVKIFAEIPMSKCMREMCKEEDYIFLNSQRKKNKKPGDITLQDSQWQQRLEERHRRRLEREQQEKEKQREVEEAQRKKEDEWKRHVAKLASDRESLQEKLIRLREFREFQKRVLEQDLGLDPDTSNERLTQLLMRL
ncbi:U2 small nuclear ribonucleoprotein auxiliary factor 35 kDa subunit-related protein 1-like [Hoplias malabaricus]|uniref:U2 small nuclear ribonucleoprotein auxiliary factor 35 kDa subunit-related protein 1-like n=1 Tax=Hoplias malabaricus TaxID=27720 RepID=UPI0034634A64